MTLEKAYLRHIRTSAYCCFLPDLTRFTASYCAGPKPCQAKLLKGRSIQFIWHITLYCFSLPLSTLNPAQTPSFSAKNLSIQPSPVLIKRHIFYEVALVNLLPVLSVKSIVFPLIMLKRLTHHYCNKESS